MRDPFLIGNFVFIGCSGSIKILLCRLKFIFVGWYGRWVVWPLIGLRACGCAARAPQGARPWRWSATASPRRATSTVTPPSSSPANLEGRTPPSAAISARTGCARPPRPRAAPRASAAPLATRAPPVGVRARNRRRALLLLLMLLDHDLQARLSVRLWRPAPEGTWKMAPRASGAIFGKNGTSCFKLQAFRVVHSMVCSASAARSRTELASIVLVEAHECAAFCLLHHAVNASDPSSCRITAGARPGATLALRSRYS